jgi:hypothetical protein
MCKVSNNFVHLTTINHQPPTINHQPSTYPRGARNLRNALRCVLHNEVTGSAAQEVTVTVTVTVTVPVPLSSELETLNLGGATFIILYCRVLRYYCNAWLALDSGLQTAASTERSLLAQTV